MTKREAVLTAIADMIYCYGRMREHMYPTGIGPEYNLRRFEFENARKTVVDALMVDDDDEGTVT